MKRYQLIAILVLSVMACRKAPEQQLSRSELGDIDINVSIKEELKPDFKEAMLLLHSFEYKDAMEKFQAVREADPDCAMAYWGEAMCHNHPLWREQNLTKAREVMALLGEDKASQRARFSTEFEKDMFEALSILYGNGSKSSRDKAYSEYMATLYEKYPDNNEVASFYALSVLGAVKGGRDFDEYARGARIAQSVIKENPNHPGALHYLIHSYDDPENASKALEAANAYSKVAPDAGHALHMPSHIYVALGMWDEVIKSNIASWEASKLRKDEKELDNDALNYHAFQWLMYAYLQKGDYETSRSLLEEMQSYAYALPSERAVNHLVMMKADYFSETGQWDDALVYDTLDYSSYSFQTKSVREWIHGMKSFAGKDALNLSAHLDSMFTFINHNTNAALTSEGGALCSGVYSWETPTQLDIDRATVLKLELEAALAMLGSDNVKAEAILKKAVALEQATSYNYGPPEIVKPSSEFYAEWLLRHNRQEEAAEQLRLVLQRAPGRRIPTNLLANLEV